MKQFQSFVIKEFRQIFRDRRTMLILLVMPVVQVLLLGYAIKTEIRDARLAVFDPSKDAETRRIKERFAASEYFILTEELTRPEQINDVFKGGDIDLVLVFGEDFASHLQHDGEAAVQLIADGTDPNQAAMLTGYASGILADCQAALLENYNAPFQIRANVRMLYNPQSESAYNFVPGVVGLVLASPMKPMHIMLSKMLPYFTLSVVNVVTVLLLAVFVMGVPIRGSLFWLAVSSVVFIFVALALGLLISTLVSRQMSALLVSGIGLMMPTIVFSGLIFPLESMPEGLRWISDFVPARWYIAIMRKIMIEGVGVAYFVKELGVIVLMAVVLMAVAWKNFKVRLV